MIRVEVREYCHDCFDFDPNITHPESFMLTDGTTIGQTDTIIRCRDRNKCENIRRYLEHNQAIKDGIRKEIISSCARPPEYSGGKDDNGKHE